MRRVKLSLLTLLIAFSGTSIFSLSTANAATTPAPSASQQAACSGLDQLDSTQSCGSGDTTFTKVVKATVSIISVVVGIVAVIMIIVSGLKYITSSGDAANVTSAKKTLIYALIGLAIAVSAQFLVHFVLNSTTKATVGVLIEAQ